MAQITEERTDNFNNQRRRSDGLKQLPGAVGDFKFYLLKLWIRAFRKTRISGGGDTMPDHLRQPTRGKSILALALSVRPHRMALAVTHIWSPATDAPRCDVKFRLRNSLWRKTISNPKESRRETRRLHQLPARTDFVRIVLVVLVHTPNNVLIFRWRGVNFGQEKKREKEIYSTPRIRKPEFEFLDSTSDLWAPPVEVGEIPRILPFHDFF